VTLFTLVVPSPTDKGLPPEVIPVIEISSPKEFVKVNVEVFELYVPPVIDELNPEILTVPPVLLNKSKIEVAE